MNPTDSMIVVHPDWMFRREGPRFDQALRGVNYEFHYDHAKLVNEAFECEVGRGDWSLRVRYAAIGPAVFFGRSNGPWLSYDVARFDENSQTKIQDRPRPWNLGDRLWELWSWRSTHTEVVTVDRSIQEHFSIYFWGVATRDNLIDPNAARWIQRRSSEQSSQFAQLIS